MESVDLRIAVMCMTARPDRRADLLSIRQRISETPLTVIDCAPRSNIWLNVRRSWLALYRGAGTHGLVMAEDMLPSKHFYRAATAALAVKPSEVVCFFTSRRASITGPAREAGKSWGVAPDAAWGGAVAMPMPLIREFLRWEEAHVSPAYPHDDGRVAIWCTLTGRKVWVTVPSLLEHVGATRSALGHGGGINRNRVASWYVDDADGIDWRSGAQDPVVGKSMVGPVTAREIARVRALTE